MHKQNINASSPETNPHGTSIITCKVILEEVKFLPQEHISFLVMCGLFSDSVCSPAIQLGMVGWLANDELEIMEKELVVSLFEVLPQNLVSGSQKYHKSFS